LEKWRAARPPPLSKYRLTFGKRRGRRLEEVAGAYLVRFLITHQRTNHGIYTIGPIIFEALEDFVKRHPNVKSHIGPTKTKLRKGGIFT
jgi:hypothetical protein